MTFRLSATALLLALALAGCGPATPVQPESTEKQDDGLFELEGLRASIHSDEGLETLIQADEAVLDLNSKAATLESVVVKRLTSGTVSGMLQSDEGVLYLADNLETGDRKNDFLLRGRENSPVQISRAGDTILAQAVRYKAPVPGSTDDEVAYVTEGGPVEWRIQAGDGVHIIKGSRFEMNRSLLGMRVFGPGELHIGAGNSAGDAVSK